MTGPDGVDEQAAAEGSPAPPDARPVEVPAAVRDVVVGLAARVVAELDPALVPARLRRVRAFAPARRARAGAGPLWDAVEHDDGFRLAVSRALAVQHPAAAAAASAAADDTGPDDVAPDDGGRSDDVAPDDGGRSDDVAPDPVLVAAAALLARPEGWPALVDAARAREDDRGAVRETDAAVRRLTGERDRARQDADRARAEAATLRADATALREELAAALKGQRRLRADADRARAEARAAREEAQAAHDAARLLAAAAEADRAAAALDLGRARAERLQAQEQARTGEALATSRARLLLDTVLDAAAGLRHELGLGPAALLPADVVAADLRTSTDAAGTAGTAGTADDAAPGAPGAPAGRAPGAPGRQGSRGRAGDDPALLDDLLAVPRTHLVVDGYNVTRTGFGTLTLADQRHRLVTGLRRVAARTGAEVTCCFDGQDLGTPGGPAWPPRPGERGVRVLFTQGEEADDLVRRLVAAEPPGRPVVVVTSDRAVADDVVAMGATAVGSPALVARLSRL